VNAQITFILYLPPPRLHYRQRMSFYKLNLPQQKPNHKINKIEAVIQLSYHQVR